MLTEKDFEDIICKYSELIEDCLIFKGRQITLFGRRMDILFEDKFKRKLIIELKVGPIKDEHIGQILSYEGMLLSGEDPTIRVMLIGNRVPPNIQKSLDHHGIAWKEISFAKLRIFLAEKNDVGFLKLFDTEVFSSKIEMPEIWEATKINYSVSGKNPALFVPVERKWIERAFDYFNEGREKIYFYTNSGIGAAVSLEIKSVYFKLKGDREITVKADFIDLITEYPKGYRLSGSDVLSGKYYYGYKRLRWLKRPVSLIDLKYFKSEKNLRTDVPGACIILDPVVE